jgi:hypothetical protein
MCLVDRWPKGTILSEICMWGTTATAVVARKKLAELIYHMLMA